MCGRYSLVCIDDLGVRFRVYDPTLGCRSHFNVAPSAMMPVIVKVERIKALTMQWGLISHRVKSANGSAHPINVRADTILEREMFSSLMEKNRCLVPASGFYEWKNEGKRTVPFYIRLKEASLFSFAGLYDVWRDMAGTSRLTYTIITTTPNELVAPLHNRMPAILKREDEERWLSGYCPASGELKRILAPYPSQDMEAYPVSSRVNNANTEDNEQLIRPLSTF